MYETHQSFSFIFCTVFLENPAFLLRGIEKLSTGLTLRTAQILDTSEKFSFVKFFQCVAFLSNRVFSNFDYL